MDLNMIKQMERFARHNPAVISLGQGIPDGRADRFIRDQVIDAIQNQPNIDRYSDPAGLLPLRQAINGQLAASNMAYNPDEILVTSGAIEAINTILLAYVSPTKNEVILPVPTYSAYQRAIALAHGTTVPIALDESDDWQLSIDAVRAAITEQTAAILLCNPNNPTGSLYDESCLRALCELARKHSIKVITDEAYGNMVWSETALYSPATEASYKQTVIRVVSFSKDFKLTGWRIGYLHADQATINRLTPVHDTLVNCAAVPSQYAALAALEIADSVIARNTKRYASHRQKMQQHLDALAPWLTYTLPQGGYFFFPKLHLPMKATELCYELLKTEQVVAIAGQDFSDTSDSHIRLCFGRPANDIEAGMQRIRHYFEKRYAR